MICFYHAESPAVGICKACCRGLCATCAAEVNGGLACRDRCEAPATASNVSRIQGIGSLVYFAVGGVIAGHGVLTGFTGGTIMGAALIALGLFLFIQGRRSRVAA